MNKFIFLSSKNFFHFKLPPKKKSSRRKKIPAENFQRGNFFTADKFYL